MMQYSNEGSPIHPGVTVAGHVSMPGQGPRSVVPSTPDTPGPRPTLLYSPNKTANLNYVKPEIKREESLEMMLVDDEQSAGQALVELAQGGPATPVSKPQVIQLQAIQAIQLDIMLLCLLVIYR